MWWLAAYLHHWTIDQWEALPGRHKRFYVERWRGEGYLETADERSAREADELGREQFVSAQQQMRPGENVTVGPKVDASQLAPSEWPGQVIDLRRR